MSDRPPPALTAFFALTTVFHGIAVLSRFDLIRDALPPVVHASILCGQLPLLLLEGVFLDRLLAGARGPEMPLWMRVPSGPIRTSFALALTYLGLFALQTWDVSLGGFDGEAPSVWPPAQRLAWFCGFALVLTFPAYLAAMSTLAPALRVLAIPLRRLPDLLVVVVAALLGAGIGLVALALVDLKEGPLFLQLASLRAAALENPIGAALLTLGAPLLGGAVGLVSERIGGRRAAASRPTPATSTEVDEGDA
ncbi:MAG: hypothetical protein R3B09_21385 [Nannocystaceae bacterium]